MNEKYKNMINPIQLLKDKNDNTLRRYNSFNNKLNFYLILLTILSSIFIFIFGNKLADMNFIFEYNTGECYQIVLKIIITVILILSILSLLFFLVLIFFEILKALEPITLTELDFEGIEFYMDKKFKKAFDTIIKDYIYTIEKNQEKMNNKYGLLFSIKRYFIIFIIIYFFIISLILGLILFKNILL